MSATDLSKIERSVFIRSPRARVWRAIAHVAEFAAWFQVKAEGEFSPNATVQMTCTVPGYEGLQFSVTIERMDPERLLTWRWHPGSEKPPAGEQPTVVEFHLADENDGTRVTVIETGFDHLSLARRAKAYEENSQGWTEQLVALHKHLSDAH